MGAKFKVGDRVRIKKESTMGYHFNGNYYASGATPDQVYVISVVEEYSTGGKYSVEGAYIQSANWNSMDKEFEFAYDLKELSKKGYKQ